MLPKKEVPMHKLTINLPKALVQRAKIKALKDGITLTCMIEHLLSQHLKRPRPREAQA
jgi:hypothetical protein